MGGVISNRRFCPLKRGMCWSWTRVPFGRMVIRAKQGRASLDLAGGYPRVPFGWMPSHQTTRRVDAWMDAHPTFLVVVWVALGQSS